MTRSTRRDTARISEMHISERLEAPPRRSRRPRCMGYSAGKGNKQGRESGGRAEAAGNIDEGGRVYQKGSRLEGEEKASKRKEGGGTKEAAFRENRLQEHKSQEGGARNEEGRRSEKERVIGSEA